MLLDESAAAFAALEAAARAELAPVGGFQAEPVTRIVAAAWRARRADRLEAALVGCHLDAGAGERTALGLALMRDGNGPRALETLVRYRGAVLAELFRALGDLKALQAEACAPVEATSATARLPAPRPATSPDRTRQPTSGPCLGRQIGHRATA